MSFHHEDKYDSFGGVARAYQQADANKPALGEKTWGHRVLLGLSVSMIVAALVVIAVCAVKLLGIGSLELADAITMFTYAIAYVGLIASALALPPAIIGILVSRKPQLALLGVVAAIVALVLAVCIFAYLFFVAQGTLFVSLLCAVALAVVPVVYLLCSLKIYRSNHAPVRGRHST